MLKGQLIYLRRIERDDLDQIWQWHVNGGLQLFGGWNPDIAYDVLHQEFEDYFHGRYDFMIESYSQRRMGVCSFINILWIHRTCEFQFEIKEGRLDIDVAMEVLSLSRQFLLTDWNMERIGVILPESATLENKALELSDFQQEGILREHGFHKGNYIDYRVYSKLQSGFQPANNSISAI